MPHPIPNLSESLTEQGAAPFQWQTLSIDPESRVQCDQLQPRLIVGRPCAGGSCTRYDSSCVAPCGGLIQFGLLVPRADARGYGVSSPAGIQEMSYRLWLVSLSPSRPTVSTQRISVGFLPSAPVGGHSLFSQGIGLTSHAQPRLPWLRRGFRKWRTACRLCSPPPSTADISLQRT